MNLCTLPAPMVTPEVDLRDFKFIPLDVVRLRDSDLMALSTGDEFKAAVTLWCVAWHQVPAASLPNDDRLLAKHSGAGPAWKKLKKMALWGFVECSDGRLYHPTIAEKANESWVKKLSQRERTRAATEAREQRRKATQNTADVERNDQRNVALIGERNVERNVDVEPQRNVVQGTGTGTGTGNKKEQAHVDAAAPTPVRPARIPYDEIVETYHAELPQLARILDLEDRRKAKLKTLWHKNKAHQDLAFWRWYFSGVRKLPFYIGESDKSRRADGKPWKADFDWLIKPDNFLRTVEKIDPIHDWPETDEPLPN